MLTLSSKTEAREHLQGAGRSIPPFIRQKIDSHNQRVEAWGGRDFFHVPAPQPGTVMLVNNDYLCIGQHPAIIEAQVQALRETDATLMSYTLLPEFSLQRIFEEQMTSYLNVEDAVLCTSGWEANVGLLQTIAGPEIPVYIDMMAHASLMEGIRSAGAQARPFRHNDVGNLERQIKRYGEGIIVVDSVYSSDGSICPLREVASLAQQYGCTFIVDESHSLGIYGERGCGMVSMLGLDHLVLFKTASLSKAFCSRGGIITCPQEFGYVFRTVARPMVFSSAVLPHEAARFIKTLEVVQAEDGRREQLHSNTTMLREGLASIGFDVSMSKAPIIPLLVRTESRVLMMRDLMAERGVMGAVFAPPATAKNRCIVRLSVHAMLSQDDIERVLRACQEALAGLQGVQ